MPGELRGLEMAHQKFGKLLWDSLFEPAAKIADDGFVISSAVGDAISSKKDIINEGNYNGMK